MRRRAYTRAAWTSSRSSSSSGGWWCSGIFLAIGKWYPGSRRRAGGLAADALARGRGRAGARRRRPDARGPERAPPGAAAARSSPRTTCAPRWPRTSAGARSCAAARASRRLDAMARVLIVGCGCRGRALAAALRGRGSRGARHHARRPARVAAHRGGRGRGGGGRPRPARDADARARRRDRRVLAAGRAPATRPTLHGDRLRTLWSASWTRRSGALVYEARRHADAAAARRGARRSCARRQQHLAHPGGDRGHRSREPDGVARGDAAAGRALLSA